MEINMNELEPRHAHDILTSAIIPRPIAWVCSINQDGQHVRQFVNIAKVARRKLRQIDIAGRLDDLRVPLGNHLEALLGDRSGQYSIRINDKWRVCFSWTDAGAENVEIVDYH